MIDVAPNHLEIVRSILREHVPDCEVRAFGSRITGKAKKHSDLDLCLASSAPLPLAVLSALAEAFEESTLPFRVDVIDWNAIPESFRRVVAGRFVLLPLDCAA